MSASRLFRNWRCNKFYNPLQSEIRRKFGRLDSKCRGAEMHINEWAIGGGVWGKL